METTAYIATSVDGYIARRNGDVDWLGQPTPETQAEFERFMSTVDCLVMGRNTYETVLSFGEWPYSKPVVVLSHRPIDVPEALRSRVRHMAGPPAEIVRQLAETGANRLYIDGGKTIQAFLAEGLLQRFIITQVPVLLGGGIPLFGSLPSDVTLTLVRSRVLTDGNVQSEYVVA